jgi:hypothetical protein
MEIAVTDEIAMDPTQCNCLALRQATRHLSQIYDRHLAEAGLRGSQYSILSKLGRLGPPTSWCWTAPRWAGRYGRWSATGW